MQQSQFAYRRILLKLSGEALMGEGDYGIDPAVIGRIAEEVHRLSESGIEIGLVIGGGNIFRGAGLAQAGMDRVTGDHMGMLATVINSLAMQDALEKLGSRVRVMSAPISMARRLAAESVVKNGLPVPAAKIATRPFSRWRTARRRI